MIETGKIPPQATDLEEAVLGALMLDKTALVQVADFLKAEMFYKPNHAVIYKAICDLDSKNEPIDILTVVNELKTAKKLTDVGGAYAITQLTSRIGGADNLVFHARVIHERYIQRQVINICSNAIKLAYEQTDVFDLINNLSLDIERASHVNSQDMTAKQRMVETIEFISTAMNSNTGLAGHSTGLATLDEITGGLIPGDLIVEGGLPGAYKSALNLSIMHYVASHGVPVLMFQQEMSNAQTGLRELGRETGIPIHRLKNGNVSRDEYELLMKAASNLENKPVYVDTSSGVDIGYIRTVSRKMAKEKGIGLIVVDYLQLMDLGDNKNNEQALDFTVKSLKILAKNLKVPVILLSAFNDSGYQDSTTPPKSKSLKGSRAIGAHADTVILLWNPSKDNPGFVYEGFGETILTDEKLGLVIDKNRMGANGIRWIGVNAATNTFFDL